MLWTWDGARSHDPDWKFMLTLYSALGENTRSSPGLQVYTEEFEETQRFSNLIAVHKFLGSHDVATVPIAVQMHPKIMIVEGGYTRLMHSDLTQGVMTEGIRRVVRSVAELGLCVVDLSITDIYRAGDAKNTLKLHFNTEKKIFGIADSTISLASTPWEYRSVLCYFECLMFLSLSKDWKTARDSLMTYGHQSYIAAQFYLFEDRSVKAYLGTSSDPISLKEYLRTSSDPLYAAAASSHIDLEEDLPNIPLGQSPSNPADLPRLRDDAVSMFDRPYWPVSMRVPSSPLATPVPEESPSTPTRRKKARKLYAEGCLGIYSRRGITNDGRPLDLSVISILHREGNVLYVETKEDNDAKRIAAFNDTAYRPKKYVTDAFTSAVSLSDMFWEECAKWEIGNTLETGEKHREGAEDPTETVEKRKDVEGGAKTSKRNKKRNPGAAAKKSTQDAELRAAEEMLKTKAKNERKAKTEKERQAERELDKKRQAEREREEEAEREREKELEARLYTSNIFATPVETRAIPWASNSCFVDGLVLLLLSWADMSGPVTDILSGTDRLRPIVKSLGTYLSKDGHLMSNGLASRSVAELRNVLLSRRNPTAQECLSEMWQSWGDTTSWPLYGVEIKTPMYGEQLLGDLKDGTVTSQTGWLMDKLRAYSNECGKVYTSPHRKMASRTNRMTIEEFRKHMTDYPLLGENARIWLLGQGVKMNGSETEPDLKEMIENACRGRRTPEFESLLQDLQKSTTEHESMIQVADYLKQTRRPQNSKVIKEFLGGWIPQANDRTADTQEYFLQKKLDYGHTGGNLINPLASHEEPEEFVPFQTKPYKIVPRGFPLVVVPINRKKQKERGALVPRHAVKVNTTIKVPQAVNAYPEAKNVDKLEIPEKIRTATYSIVGAIFWFGTDEGDEDSSGHYSTLAQHKKRWFVYNDAKPFHEGAIYDVFDQGVLDFQDALAAVAKDENALRQLGVEGLVTGDEDARIRRMKKYGEWSTAMAVYRLDGGSLPPSEPRPAVLRDVDIRRVRVPSLSSHPSGSSGAASSSAKASLAGPENAAQGK